MVHSALAECKNLPPLDLLLNISLFVVSLIVLLYASDKFVDSAEKIGLSLGISPFIIGVTIIAFGTSLPEMATSIAAVYSGTSEIVVANVIGSNITNILLVLGITAYVGKEIIMDFDVMDTDMPMLFGSAFLLYFVLSDGYFSTIEVAVFIVGLVIFLISSFKQDKAAKEDCPTASVMDYILLLLAGVFVFLGANYTIHAIEEIATIAQINPHVIAITVVALGTSLPELIVSITAARKGKHAMAVGNVLGSNLFNTYAVMGISALFGTLTIPDELVAFDLLFMVAVTILFGIICIRKRISQWEGAVLVLFYIFFIGHSIEKIL